ncbi:MAG: GNAT family N-acetyltransferase, partial [Actinomycetota bacterium]|nr:GNAT family N-acetyltransferase [Actinomycetota bacterium]
MDPVTLRDDDLLLRPWRPEDAPAVHAACQDPEIQRWTLVPSPYSEADARDFVGGSDQRWATGKPSFAAVDATTGALLGSFGVVAHSDEGDPEIGYWVTVTARGRGVATRATILLCRWLFEEQEAVRIAWHAVAGNVASRRAAEAAGFVIEGTARQGMTHRDERVDAWVAS